MIALKNVIYFCLNSIVEQYNISANLGTFFMSHPVYDGLGRGAWRILSQAKVTFSNLPPTTERIQKTKT